jgi:hypothetical protein
VDAGGDKKTFVNENYNIATAEVTTVAGHMGTLGAAFKLSDSGQLGVGAFSTRTLYRGDLILVEKPLYTVPEDATPPEVMLAVGRLTEEERATLAELYNAFTDGHLTNMPFAGIHQTNAFASGKDESILCLQASRFNHSCSPNARYSWHTQSETFRIYALREIAVGEEILVSYISSRNVYGSDRNERRERLKSKFNFLCACAACTLPADKQSISDHRRREITRLYDSVPFFMPHQTEARLRAIAQGVRLMLEEGHWADTDDFTHDAAGICAFHSDWASVAYWARRTYEARAAEFGADSLHATEGEVQTLFLDPQKYQMAGMGKVQVFSVRL